GRSARGDEDARLLDHHRHVPAGRPGAGETGGHHRDGQRGGEETARAGPPRRRGAAMRRERPLLFFALLYPTLLAWFYFVQLAGDASRPNPAQQAAYGVGKAFQFVLPVLFFWWFDRSRLQASRPRFDKLGFAIGFSLVTAAAMFLLYFGWLKQTPVFASAPERIGEKLRQFGLKCAVGFLAIGLFVSLLHSLLEEYYWRWFLFGRLRDHFSFPAACTVSSLGFMAHHVIVLAVYLPGYFWTAVVP